MWIWILLGIVLAYPLWLCFSILLGLYCTWLDVRGNDYGVYLISARKGKKWSFFFPRSKEAKVVVAKYALPRHRYFFGGFMVRAEKEKEVYEQIMHDPETPQSISQKSRLGVGVTLTDIP